MSMDGVPYVRVCVQGEGTGWESAFLASLTGSGSYGWSEGKCRGIKWGRLQRKQTIKKFKG